MKKLLQSKTRKMNLSQKILLVSIIVITTICGIIGFTVYYKAEQELVSSIKKRVENSTAIISANIDGDLHDSFDESSRTSEEYLSMQALLASFLKMDGVEYAYTLKPISSSKLQFIVSTDDYGTDTNCMELTYDITDTIQKTLDGNIISDDTITSDEWGSYISGYAPIYNSKNELVAIVGVDISASSITAKLKNLVKMILLFTLLFWILSIVIFSFFISRLRKNLTLMIDKMDTLANTDGDLTNQIEIHSGDELELVADNINLFIQKIRGVLTKVDETAGEVTEFSNRSADYFDETSEEVHSISQSMQNLCGSTQEIQSSMESISSSVHQVFSFVDDTCKEAFTQTESCTEIANRATALRKQSEDVKGSTFGLIQTYKDQLSNQIEKAKSVAKINDLTKDIIEISSQTNLLSLNASIEAARAGEHGRSFSIVASEIGTLADVSSKTAEEISAVNNIIIDAVDGFSNLGASLIDYLDSSVIKDYDAMVSYMEQYRKDATNIMEIMNAVYQNSLALQTQFGAVTASIETISSVLNENSREMEAVTSVTDHLNTSIHSMKTQVEQNQILIAELDQTLKFFTI